MDDRRTWRPSRYVTLLTVLMFHVTLIAALVISSKPRRIFSATTNPIEVVFIAPTEAHKVRAEAPLSHTLETLQTSISSDAAFTLPPDASSGPDRAGPPVDWAGDARAVAAAVVAKTDSREGPDSSQAPKSATPGNPSHHAGEQYRLDGGGWVVFVSDDCYQISNAMPTVPTALGNGMGLQTFCLGDSSAPRGDLFDQLSAYKKYHPN
jgi:hypothetical protein